MGQQLSTVQSALKVTTEENKKAAEEALKAVQQLAESELELFYSRVTSDNFDTKLIPIDRVIKKEAYIFAETSTGPKKTEEIIEEVAGNFAKKETAKGVGKIIDNVFGALLGEAGAGMKKQEK
ncbi:MAG: hypothetical protein Q9216_003816 [Gyalolechia sp. 2 TL-2023]